MILGISQECKLSGNNVSIRYAGFYCTKIFQHAKLASVYDRISEIVKRELIPQTTSSAYLLFSNISEIDT